MCVGRGGVLGECVRERKGVYVSGECEGEEVDVCIR